MTGEVWTAQRSILVAAGPVGIGLQVEETWLDKRIREKYRGFLEEREPDITLRIRLQKEPMLVSSAFDQDFNKNGFEIDLPDSTLELDLQHNQGSLVTSNQVVEEAVELTLRILVAILAARSNGFLFHSAGIVHMGRGCLFFGPSGSGKTTVARFSQGDRVLNDDLVFLSQKTGVWSMHSTPFTNADQIRPKAFCSNITALFRLVQDDRVFIERIGSAEALAEVIASIPILPAKPDFTSQLLQLAGELIQTVPVYRLHFLPDSTFWKIVESEIKDSHEYEKYGI